MHQGEWLVLVLYTQHGGSWAQEVFKGNCYQRLRAMQMLSKVRRRAVSSLACRCRQSSCFGDINRGNTEARANPLPRRLEISGSVSVAVSGGVRSLLIE